MVIGQTEFMFEEYHLCYENGLLLEIGGYYGNVIRFLPSLIIEKISSQLCCGACEMLWGGKFWTSGYYINTVGYYGNEKIISEYVKNQGRSYKQIYRGTLSLFQGVE